MFKTKKAAFQAALSSVKDAVNSKNTIPHLANIAVERHAEGIRLRATNLDIEIAAPFQAEIGADFSGFTFPAKTVTSIVGAVDDGKDISFEAVMLGNKLEAVMLGNKLEAVTIRSGRSRIKVPILPLADFPILDQGELPFAVSLGSSSFIRCLSAVDYACSTEETRHYLNGVFLDASEAGLMFVATDGHRMARRLLPSSDVDDPIESMPKVILPRETAPLLVKHLPKDETLSISLSEFRIRFAAGNIVIISKLVEGTYPDYRRLSPGSHKIRARISGAELKAAIARVLTVNTEKGNAVRFTFDKTSATLTSRPGDAGEAEDVVTAASDGEFVVGMNGAYLRESIDHLDTEEIELDFNDPASPILLRKPGETDTHTIIMPMRV
ncbi:DNA polymerase III subunit beta [Sinorhizobium meliloti]|uniref:DNA polymerase III subunit beta n=1 Tax=Rhizobium meliloti TaxID=382 RepID=UPI000FD2F81A|nr:DNA polymerase III subunit beta [Sinorhizobium meliloti]RVL43705.1 DNA polymerase III subunit beta [Sinorhizobium meliloti]RVL63202.1 DNA polymerase III subunit beta [Sinorhizobium meliloti]RVP50251.1 DNA polymerase III subunit beta [Sinorhizobium meliloti]RVP82521.1 DNA polymerase III subunit beta [Sinorhizobium meliloti]